MRFGPRQVIPETPNSLLGTSFHKVMEVAALGRFPAAEAGAAQAARLVFEDEAQKTFDAAHPLLKMKYPTKQHLPNYFLQRERAVAAATRLSVAVQSQIDGASRATSIAAPRPEQTLTSVDGLLKGKIDWLKAADSEVVDYKAGIVPQGEGLAVSDRERRQLTFYAYLAHERGHVIQKGTIVRSNGRSCSIQISPQETAAIAEDARRALADYNRDVESGKTFAQLARPAKESCWFCPCIPFCEQFWQAQKTGWTEYQGFGWHIQGTVTQLSAAAFQGLDVITMTLATSAGTDIPNGSTLAIEQLPSTWVSTDPATLPKLGDVIRVVHARKAHPETSLVFRADKALSSLWRVPT